MSAWQALQVSEPMYPFEAWGDGVAELLALFVAAFCRATTGTLKNSNQEARNNHKGRGWRPRGEHIFANTSPFTDQERLMQPEQQLNRCAAKLQIFFGLSPVYNLWPNSRSKRFVLASGWRHRTLKSARGKASRRTMVRVNRSRLRVGFIRASTGTEDTP